MYGQIIIIFIFLVKLLLFYKFGGIIYLKKQNKNILSLKIKGLFPKQRHCWRWLSIFGPIYYFLLKCNSQFLWL
jgi:hypothetical protein